MSLAVNSACAADTTLNVVGKQSVMGTVIPVLSCAAALLVLRFGHNKTHHQIEITSRTDKPFGYNRTVPYHIIEVGRLACL